MFLRIGIENTAAQDSQGATARGECAAMCRGVDAACQSTDNGEASSREFLGQLVGSPQSIVTGSPHANDGNAEGIGWFEWTAAKEDSRWIVNFVEQSWVSRIGRDQDFDLVLLTAADDPLRVPGLLLLTNCLAEFCPHSRDRAQLFC